MSYDPAKDWDVYCAQHPEPPDVDQIDSEYYISNCCGDTVTTLNIDNSKVYRCGNCGKFATIDIVATIYNYIKLSTLDASDAMSEAAASDTMW